MGRPKGSKNVKSNFSTGGHEVTTPKVLPVYSSEDLELDRELERLAKEEPIVDTPAGVVDQPVKKEKSFDEPLSEFVDSYSPAASVNELADQVFQAKSYGATAVEATPALVKHYIRGDFEYVKEHVGYFMFQDIKVYIAGLSDKTHTQDQLTIEQKLFGTSK